MLPRSAKASFYRLAGPLMWANGVVYRTLRAPRSGCHKVHLGPGQKNYLNGWINLDANIFTGKCDLWADLRNSLPFHSNTIDAMYSHHVIEHLTDLDQHFAEAYRCLKPGGVYRVGGPNGDSAIRKFLEEDASWFSDFPQNRSSIGGRFDNFLLCSNEHLTILTQSYVSELMYAAGFREVTRCNPQVETQFREMFEPCLELEYESDFTMPHTLIVEGLK